MKSSDNSPPFSRRELFAVAASLIVVGACAAAYFYSHGYLLYYGDAQAHLDISRSIIDSRTPGYDQLGTVWLPMLHVICLPFVGQNAMWQSGLAGTIPVEVCFIIAGVCLYFAARDAFSSRSAAAACLACFGLNPNVLYLASIPMTEVVFLAGLSICLLSMLRFGRTQRAWWAAIAVCASWWMSLTRYDGWFLIPFVAFFLAIVARQRKAVMVLLSGTGSALAPIYWLAHNWWETGNFLDFYNGPYSAIVIQGHRSYPGYHDWHKAVLYYWEAGRLCSGNALIILGIAGLVAVILRGPRLAAGFLALTPVFYVWSLHGSSTPIHLPTLYPFSYYNSRYGIALVVLMAFAAAGITAFVPARWRRARVAIACGLPFIAAGPWIMQPSRNAWICWKESEQNSIERRQWTALGVAYLTRRYSPGDGILLESGTGDVSGILCKAKIPLRQAIDIGNGPIWFANTMEHGLVHQAKWAMAQDGDGLSKRLTESDDYRVTAKIDVAKAPALLIYQRELPVLIPSGVQP